MAPNILITRPGLSDSNLQTELEKLGYKCVSNPVIETVNIPLVASEKAKIKLLEDRYYSWVILSSANAVKYFKLTLKYCSLKLPHIKIAVQGRSTGKSFEENFNRCPDFCPQVAVSEDFASELLGIIKLGERVLAPIAQGSRRVVEGALSRAGIKCSSVVLYETRSLPLKEGVLDALTTSPEAWQVVVLSPSAVKAIYDGLGQHANSVFPRVRFVSIGPITSREVSRLGGSVLIEAGEHSEQGIIKSFRPAEAF